VNGTWQHARQIPGISALSLGGAANAVVVSCGGTGNCSIGGSYTDGASHLQAFVATESRGIWHMAEEVPGTGALNGSGNAGVASLSCGAPGNCGAVGSTSSGPFVVNETQGPWGTAGPVPGLAALNKGNNARATSISCPSASSCAMGGQYTDSAGRLQVFEDTETGGVWGDATQIPGTAVQVHNGAAQVISVSCASPGNCSAVGYDEPGSSIQPFAVTETNGVWGNAQSVSGVTSFTTLSCGSPGNCVAGGDDGSAFTNGQAVVLSSVNGIWGKAATVRGTVALNLVNAASVTTVSCPSDGNCAVAGYVTQPQGDYTVALPFVENEAQGVWDKAQVYYSGVGPAGINSVSCASPENCSAGGPYNIGNGCDGKAAAFVADETPVKNSAPGQLARPARPAVC
jgi:hypothetical protein